MPTDVLEVTKKFMRDPIRILVKKEELTLEGIKQFYINVEREVICLIVKHKNVAPFFFLPSWISTVLKLQKLGSHLGFCNNASRVHTRRRVTALGCKRLGWTSFLMSNVLCLKIWCNMSLDQSNNEFLMNVSWKQSCSLLLTFSLKYCRNGSWIHFVTCMRHWQLHRLLFFSIQGVRWTGSLRKCMPGISQFLLW